MKKKKLEKKLRIDKDTVINCSTAGLCMQVREILASLKLKWSTGNSYLSFFKWGIYGSNTCLNPFKGEFGSKEYYYEALGKFILPAEEFIALHKKVKQDRDTVLTFSWFCSDKDHKTTIVPEETEFKAYLINLNKIQEFKGTKEYTDAEFISLAEKYGGVYSLGDFEDDLNNEDLIQENFYVRFLKTKIVS